MSLRVHSSYNPYNFLYRFNAFLKFQDRLTTRLFKHRDIITILTETTIHQLWLSFHTQFKVIISTPWKIYSGIHTNNDRFLSWFIQVKLVGLNMTCALGFIEFRRCSALPIPALKKLWVVSLVLLKTRSAIFRSEDLIITTIPRFDHQFTILTINGLAITLKFRI